MPLADLIQTKEMRPAGKLKIVISGSAKVGKTTWSQNAPKPIFISLENSDISLTADSFARPSDYPSILRYLDMLLNENHAYETLVIDSVDWLMPLLDHYVIQTQFSGRGTIGSQGFGRGLEAQALEFRNFLNWLEVLSKKMNIILIAHNKIKTVNNPMLAEGYDAITLKLPEKVGSLLIEFADVLAYAHMRLVTSGSETIKVASTNERILGVEQSPAYPSGNRLDLKNIALDANLFWTTIHQIVNAKNPAPSKLAVVETKPAEVTPINATPSTKKST